MPGYTSTGPTPLPNPFSFIIHQSLYDYMLHCGILSRTYVAYQSTASCRCACAAQKKNLHILGRIFWHKRDEITGKWRRLRNEELNDLYSSPTIIWVITARIRWHAWCTGKLHIGLWWGDPTERDCLEDLRVDGIIIKWIWKEVGCGGMDWIDLVQDRRRWRSLVNAVKKLRVP